MQRSLKCDDRIPVASVYSANSSSNALASFRSAVSKPWHMKTRWGSCTPRKRSIRLNTQLAKKRAELLEYVVVHEMAHLIVEHHNDPFTSIMDEHLPHWRMHRQALNSASLGHETWRY